MPPTRRTNERRRRIVYSANHAADENPSIRSGREFERLREARRPTAMYGERVQRRLQGRWFSLVPITQRTFAAVSVAILSTSLVLCVLHYAAVSSPSLAYQPEISRPFRLDRSDSIGSWYLSILLLGGSGISLLIYQLRRYRLDDYVGQYRLWRTILVGLAISSLGQSVGLTQWMGAILDSVLGQRVAMAGTDWLRLLISLAVAVLTLRVIAEVYRCRMTLLGVVAAAFFFLIPELAGWNVVEIDGPAKWALVTSAPMLSVTCLFIGLGAYLRMLYRQVCDIEDGPSWRERLGEFKQCVFQNSPQVEAQEPITEKTAQRDRPKTEDAGTTKRRWWHRSPKPVPENSDQSNTGKGDRAAAGKKTATGGQTGTNTDELDAKPKRRFGLGWRLRPRATPPANEDIQLDHQRSQPAAASTPERAEGTSKSSEEPQAKPRKSRFGLGSLLKRRQAKPPEPTGEQRESKSSSSNQDLERSTSSSETSNEFEDSLDADSIDWDSLSKAERRRLRKQLKRQNRAA